MATIKDVAKAAGCSISTVSYALNNDKRIPKITANRIKSIAEEIGYFPSGAARSLKKRNTKRILVAISNFGGPVYHELLEGIHYQLQKHGYTMIVSTGSSSDTLLKERSADGAIITDINIATEMLIQVAKNFRPIIVLDRRIEDDSVYNMTLNNQKAMYELTKNVIHKGYRKIAFVHGVRNVFDNVTRYDGFLQAIKEENQEVYNEFIGNFTKQSGIDIALELLEDKSELPDMFICANDEMAIGIMETLQLHGYKVPKDFGICGFDDIELAGYTKPSLSTVKINHFEWGKSIAKTLLKLLNFEKTEIIQQKGEIMIRDSF